MSGGLARLRVMRRIPVFVAMTTMAGCSLFIHRAPQPAPSEPVAVPGTAGSEPAAPDMDAAPPAETEPAPGGESRPPTPHVRPRKPRPDERPQPVRPVLPSAPVQPPPQQQTLSIRMLARDQARGMLDGAVQRPDGKIVGHAVDMVADASGAPREIVINLMGFLGVGDRKVSFAWSAVRFRPAGGDVPFTLDVGGSGVQAAAHRSAAASDPASFLPMFDAGVENAGGLKIGRVVDILLDSAARPQAVIIDVSNPLSPERRNIAVDWSALRLVSRDKALHLRMDFNDTQLQVAPRYTGDASAQIVAPLATSAPAAATPAASASQPRAER
jgi:hypothetical protein